MNISKLNKETRVQQYPSFFLLLYGIGGKTLTAFAIGDGDDLWLSITGGDGLCLFNNVITITQELNTCTELFYHFHSAIQSVLILVESKQFCKVSCKVCYSSPEKMR